MGPKKSIAKKPKKVKEEEEVKSEASESDYESDIEELDNDVNSDSDDDANSIASGSTIIDNDDEEDPIESECIYDHVYTNTNKRFEELTGDPVKIPDNQRISNNKMNKYELARVLGIRVKQISEGADVYVDGIDGMDPIEIAIHEISMKASPLLIRRPLPNGTYEEWKMSELDITIGDDVRDLIDSN